MKSTESLEKELIEFTSRFTALKAEIQKAIVGYDELLTDTLAAIFSQGHVLLEGVPGLGKTYLVKVISEVVGLEPGRVQCTPDLMPADILGTQIVNVEEGKHTLHFEKGPVFKNLLLVDEINRATPKTQAALLEVMQEHCVTQAGKRYELPVPFFVLATQNPMEMEGTYPLPEAQLDRFLFKIKVPFPNAADLVEISKRTTGSEEIVLNEVMTAEELIGFQETLSHVPIADPLTEYAAQLVLGTHPDTEGASDKVKRYVSYGSSPRGMQALIRGAKIHAVLAGRTAVAIEDIKRVTGPALRHRTILNFEGEAESISVETLIDEVVDSVGTPSQARLSSSKSSDDQEAPDKKYAIS